MILGVVFAAGCQDMPYDSEQFPCNGHLHLHFVFPPDYSLVVVEAAVERILGSGRAPRALYHCLPEELVSVDDTP